MTLAFSTLQSGMSLKRSPTQPKKPWRSLNGLEQGVKVVLYRYLMPAVGDFSISLSSLKQPQKPKCF
ncbi:MAG TPA: hypothetical protein V6C91_03250 [Coleofasciculaceae cyanobacterium]